jgi:hypothetical protein
MTEIHHGRIDGRSAWAPAEIGGREGFTRIFREAELAALDELLDRTAALDKFAITRADFDHPLINRVMAEARAEIMDGRGAAILSGFDLARYDQEAYERAYWGLGTHLGKAVIQSGKGDLIGYVQKTESAVPRGYLSDLELRPHTDFHEILSLAGVRSSAEGGVSGLASSHSIHNAIAAERPDLLQPLYDGYWYALPDGQGGDNPCSDGRVPVFSNVDGDVSCMNNGFFIHTAAKRRGEELPAKLVEALDYFNKLSVREDILAQFMLEPGEMLFWHNFVCLHSRTEFHDSPTQKRLLLRLWLNVPEGRRVVPEIRAWTERLDRNHRTKLAAA